MATKVTRKRPDVRDTILREATRLFADRGFGGVALRDIAHACNIPLSTLSSHFPRKDSLQEAVFQRAVEIIIKRELASNLGVGDPEKQLKRYFANIVELMLSDLPEMKVVEREFQELDKPDIFSTVVRTFSNQPVMDSLNFIAEMARTTNSSILKSISPVRFIQMASACIYGIVKLSAFHRHVVGAKAVSKEAIKRDVLSMFEHMLR